MKLLRLLHLSLALVVPALTAILCGALLRLLGQSNARIAQVMAWLVGRMGPALAGLRIQCEQASRLHCGPAVILFNHQSGLDPVIVASLLRGSVTGVAKQGLAHNPLLGPLLRLTGSLFVRRGDGWEDQLLPQAEARIRQGFSIVIAPEGTRGTGQGVGPFRLGAFAIARHCQIPVIPVVIHNSAQRLAARSTQLHPGPVYVSVLPPMQIEPTTDLKQAAQEMEQCYVRWLAQGYGTDH